MENWVIGKYQVHEALGHGGLSHVYAATDTETGRRVAIKIAQLPEDLASRDSFTRLFLQQVSVAARLQHSSAISILDQGTTADGSPYFVMERLNGEALDHILHDQSKLPVADAVSIARQVASALGAAHDLGFIHRDVKPGNIFVMDTSTPGDPKVKLLDFGVADRLNETTGTTLGGGLFGSPNYMSPEQLYGKPLTPASDIWQLGITMFEMLAGSRPFAGAGVSVLLEIAKATPPSLESLGIPGPLAAFVNRCLAKDPAQRPQNGREALDVLTGLEATTADVLSRPSPTQADAWGAPALPAPLPPPMRVGAVMSRTVVTLPAPTKAAAAAPRYLALALLVAGLVLCAALLSRHSGSGHPSSGAWIGVIIGIVIVASGIFLGKSIRDTFKAKRLGLAGEAHEMLSLARNRDQLSQTLAIQVDTIAARCKLADEKFLAMTMAIMVDEYGTATTTDDRQKSLMNAVTLLEKLTTRLTPWYVRQEKLIALGVTLIGVISGLVTIAQNVLKLMHGS